MFCCVLHFKLDVSLYPLSFPPCYLKLAFLPELFTPCLPVASKALAQHLFAQVSLGGKFPQLCFFPPQATIPCLSCSLTNSPLLLSAPSCHRAPPQKTWTPHSSVVKCFENTDLSHTTYPWYVDLVYMLISCIFSVFRRNFSECPIL